MERIEMNENAPVIEEKDIKLPMICAGCGTEEGLKLFGFRTNAYSATQRQLIPYCRECALRVIDTLIESWPDIISEFR